MVNDNDRKNISSDQSSDGEIYIDAAISPTTTRVEEKRENARAWITYSLIGLVSIIIVGTLIGASFNFLDKDKIEVILTAALPPIVALLGSAMGFYFGSSK